VWEIAEITHRASTDDLTGLANRRSFDDRFRQVCMDCDRFGQRAAVVLMDIDHFKQVNDTHGHQVGDAVIRAVARALVDGVRSADTCARYGGEELALVLPGTPSAGATLLAGRICERIGSAPIQVEGLRIPVTVSAGVAEYPSSGKTPAEVIAAADRALYSAKRAGRNRVCTDGVS
jgi:diguanylate cyclase (GGDEF)-like protein